MNSSSEEADENGSGSFISTFSTSTTFGFSSTFSFDDVKLETGTFFPNERLCCPFYGAGFLV